jgi:hypothetical protein
MIEAAGTSSLADAALAYSAGWRKQSASGSVAATAAGMATQAAGAQPSPGSVTEDTVSFCDTALQALATCTDGGLAMSLGLQQASATTGVGSVGQASTSLALSLEIQSSQEAAASTASASLNGFSILVEGKNGNQLFGGDTPDGAVDAADQQFFVTEALAAATQDANAGAFSIDVCHSSIDVGVSATNDDLEIGIDAHGQLSVTDQHTTARNDGGELLAYESSAQILPINGNATLVTASAPTHFSELTGLDTTLGKELMHGDMDEIPGLNNSAIPSNTPPALSAWRNNKVGTGALARPGSGQTVATSPGLSRTDAGVALASLTAFEKVRHAAMQATARLRTKPAAVSAIA